MSVSARQFAFTWFGETKPKFVADKMQYLVYQKESCPETKRIHFQGYVILKTPLRLKNVQELLECPKCHMEKSIKERRAKGIAYCKKEGRLEPAEEFGESEIDPKGQQGRRTDLEMVCTMIKAGKRMEEVAESYPMQIVKYNRGLAVLKKLLQPAIPKWRNITVTVIWGPPGSGKSRKAGELFPEAFWKSGETGMWFDGLEHNEAMIWDDFKDTQMAREQFLRICDGHPLQLQTKGGMVWCNLKNIIFTSNFDPKNWYGGPTDKAVQRRLTYTEACLGDPPIGRSPATGGDDTGVSPPAAVLDPPPSGVSEEELTSWMEA